MGGLRFEDLEDGEEEEEEFELELDMQRFAMGGKQQGPPRYYPYFLLQSLKLKHISTKGGKKPQLTKQSSSATTARERREAERRRDLGGGGGGGAAAGKKQQSKKAEEEQSRQQQFGDEVSRALEKTEGEVSHFFAFFLNQ